jgi:predicted nucleotide-binding protein (sugar kinase/HSP70/actin superfamily)
VLLHGQTMLSDPLPLAVTERLRSFAGAPAWALVPPHPGHRACFGLVRTMLQAAPPGADTLQLSDFLGATFDKRIIECRGAVCGDAAARCNRTSLSCRGTDGGRLTFTLGGCTAINELFGRKGQPKAPPPRDAYKEIWDFIAAGQPKSDAPDRLVLARSFCVSEWAFLFARAFERLGIPVHVDEVRESDLVSAQGLFNIDTCAPHMGAVGQYRRLAASPHGVILVPQIEDLPAGGQSRGLTCTLNQGGVAVAQTLAGLAHPDARFHPFSVHLSALDAGAICDQVEPGFRSVFARYGLSPSPAALRAAFAAAIDEHHRLRRGAADLAASLAEEAIAEGRQVAVVVGREYVLNPGLYDSSVRRLLRDQRMTAIPSYVLDVDLDPGLTSIYWRNPHAIVTILKAVADRTLHRRLRHARLAAVFRGIEDREPPGPLLPVVQVSTFSCGPDSVTAHLIADIMRRRPFLLLQSDAILKELAHLENRVNTYVKQLDLGLHAELRLDDGTPFEVRRIDQLHHTEPLDRERDVLYLPTLGDNRPITAVLRSAGIACIDNWDDSYDLSAVIREGRRFAGDAVCAPLAAVYGDLLRAVQDFTERHRRGDPLVRGKRRLLYFDNQGDGPCRQGQYAEVHTLLASGAFGGSGEAGGGARTPALPGGAVLRLLLAQEHTGFGIGLEEWTMARAYQAVIVHGLLQDLLFQGGARCRDRGEYEQLAAEHRQLKDEIHAAFESFRGPDRGARWLIGAASRAGVGAALKYFAYRLDGRDLTPLVRRFARRWIHDRPLAPDHLRIHVSGEVYMRVAQAEKVFQALLSIIGFRRFDLSVSPIWSYVEYLPEDQVLCAREAIDLWETKRRRAATAADRRTCDEGIRVERRRIRDARRIGVILRQRVARPLYRAAGLRLPDHPAHLFDTAREVLPTLRPRGELALYVGEALAELRAGVDVFLSVAPTGCMVTSMGEVMTPKLQQAGAGRIQSLFSADGDVDEELLGLALLRALGPERFAVCGVR